MKTKLKILHHNIYLIYIKWYFILRLMSCLQVVFLFIKGDINLRYYKSIEFYIIMIITRKTNITNMLNLEPTIKIKSRQDRYYYNKNQIKSNTKKSQFMHDRQN
jgi:hypothetical protein